jgi:protein dithiol:quinone oxidoreductase
MQARLLWPLAVLLPLAAVAAALVSQHVFDMQPCPWCVLQRVIFVALALVALTGWLIAAAVVRRAAALVMAVLAGCGIAAALWQHFVAASSVSCNLTLADRIVSMLGLDSLAPDVFAAYASCADAAVKLFGLPYEFWSLALFVLLGAAAIQLLRRPR